MNRHYPIIYSSQALRHAGLDNKKFEKEEFDALDPAICVQGHLLAHVRSESRPPDNGNPLESMGWADLVADSPGYAEGSGSLQYVDNMENRDMWDTASRHEAFML
ncbi:hypothetical protein DL769_001052 [Monosporascus sp. CRB-8-3]|nr:hypothetical protein DL769_001052 [Monosporascus sp. CRB-8-3]